MKFLILCVLVAGAFALPQRRIPYHRGRTGIVGGTDAAPGEFPWQLSFQEDFLGGYFHFCGASSYNPGVSICAGHCVYGENYDSPTGLYVVGGEHVLSVDSGVEQRVTLRRIILHEAYDPGTFENDISLLFGATDFVYTAGVLAGVGIPTQNQEFSGDFVVTGWGTTSEGGSSADTLQKVTVPYVDDATCQSDYVLYTVVSSMICAGAEGVDSCQGDSGGPMTQNGVLVGIVSWGVGCARPGKPGVYTQASYFVDWIEANEGG